jgi:hypothetical protein
VAPSQEKPGDGFQGWHKITKTIVVNLACIIKSDKGKEEEELKAMG